MNKNKAIKAIVSLEDDRGLIKGYTMYADNLVEIASEIEAKFPNYKVMGMTFAYIQEPEITYG